MAIVYRIQTREGKGPYNDGAWYGDYEHTPAFLKGLYNRDIEPDPWPSPLEDGLAFVDRDEHFGFASVEALVAWFFRSPEDGPGLSERGHLVTVWEVPDEAVRHGRHQVVFHRHRARLIEEVDPAHFQVKLPSSGVYISSPS